VWRGPDDDPHDVAVVLSHLACDRGVVSQEFDRVVKPFEVLDRFGDYRGGRPFVDQGAQQSLLAAVDGVYGGGGNPCRRCDFIDRGGEVTLVAEQAPRGVDGGLTGRLRVFSPSAGDTARRRVAIGHARWSFARVALQRE
jgi:hypothetical protein